MNTFSVAASFDRLAGWTGFGAGVAAATWKGNEEVALQSRFLTLRWVSTWAVMLYWSCWPPYDDWSECQRPDAWGNWKSLEPPCATSTRQTITLLSHVGLHVAMQASGLCLRQILHWYGPDPAVNYFCQCCSCDMGMKEVAHHNRFLTLRWAGSWASKLYWSCWPLYDDWSECLRRDAWGNWKF
jgi:hypothetical protein